MKQEACLGVLIVCIGGGRIVLQLGTANSPVHCHDPTINLEAVAFEDLWIWHCYFGLPGSHNDINVLHRSHLFARLACGTALGCNVNVRDYDKGYYLADVIYPSWSTFVKTVSNP